MGRGLKSSIGDRGRHMDVGGIGGRGIEGGGDGDDLLVSITLRQKGSNPPMAVELAICE